MKRYISAAHQTYKGVTIYDKDGVFYIYTGRHGTGRTDFSNAKEAIEYIDDMQATTAEHLHKYRVDYLNTTRNLASIYVDAKDENDAKRVAKSKMHSEIWSIEDVVKLD